MKKRNKIQWLLTLAALPFLATAGASAHQWISSNTPLQASTSLLDNYSSTRVHSIMLNASGGIEGSVANMYSNDSSGTANLNVYFVRNGKIVNQSQTDRNGKFRINSLPQGSYSFFATGEQGFATYGVNVVPHQTGVATNIMEAALVSPNIATVKELLRRNTPTSITREIEETSNISDSMTGANRIKLVDGALHGRVVPLVGTVDRVEGTNINIVQNDQTIAQVQAGVDGSFTVSDLQPGIYDFVAAGQFGFAAISFEAVAELETEIPVAIEPFQAQDFAGSLEVPLSCGCDAGFIDATPEVAANTFETPIEFVSESVSCGGACGGSGGLAQNFSRFSVADRGGLVNGRLILSGALSGGRLRGSTGLRRLLLGGLAGGIVAIAVDDDEEVASPVGPN